MKVEVAVLAEASLRSLMVSVDVKQQENGRRSELKSCVKVEVDVAATVGNRTRTRPWQTDQ